MAGEGRQAQANSKIDEKFMILSLIVPETVFPVRKKNHSLLVVEFTFSRAQTNKQIT